MSTHAQRPDRLRAIGTASLALTAAALLVTMGAGPASAEGENPVPAPEQTTDTPRETPSTDNPAPATATVSGRVWDDKDHDGTQDDGEPGVAGIGVILRPLSSPEAKAGKAVASRPVADEGHESTDADGAYKFEDVAAGSYTMQIITKGLTESAPTTWQFSPRDQGDDATDSDFSGQNIAPSGETADWYGFIDLMAVGGSDVDMDAGIFKPATDTPDGPKNNGAFCGTVWEDKDRDGTKDAGEPAVRGLPVDYVKDGPGPNEYLKRAARKAGSKSVSKDPSADEGVTTDAEGGYCFRGLTPGSYVVRVFAGPFFHDGESRQIKKLWNFTTKDAAADDVDSDFALLDTEDEVLLGKVATSESTTVSDDKTVVLDAGVYGDDPAPPATGGSHPTDGSLPVTGAAVGGFLTAGALLVGGGVALTVLGRRRRKATAA